MKKKIIIILFLMWATIGAEAKIFNADSLEKIINYQIKNNIVQHSTLHQFYKLITIYTYKNPVKALQYCFLLEFYSKKLNYQYDLASSYNKIGLILFNQNLLDDALYYYNKSLRLYSNINDSNAVSYALNDIGNIYYYQNKGDSAVIKYRQAVDECLKLNNFDCLALSYNNLGFYYNYNFEYDKAILYLTKSLELRKKLKDSELEAHSYEFIGTFYTARKQFDSAEVYYKNAANIFSKEETTIHIFDCLTSYSDMYILKGLPVNNILALLERYDIYTLINAFPPGVNIFYNIGKTYFYQNKYNEAKYFLNLSVDNAEKYKDNQILSDSYELLSEIESKHNNKFLAFDYYKQYSQIKDSIFKFSASKILKEMVQRYNTISDEKEISNLENARAYDRKIILLSGIFFLMLVIGIVIIYRNSREKAKYNYLLNNVINSLTHPFVLIKVDNFEVVLANQASYTSDVKILEKDKLNKCYYSICRLDNVCNQYGLTCPVIEIQKTLKPMITEHRYINIDNKPVYREIHAFPLTNKKGKLTMVIEYMFDITERKKLEEDLKKFFVAVEHAPSDIVITNFKGLIEYVNPHFQGTTGYQFEEAKGKNPRILKSGKMSKEFIKNLWDTILDGKVWFGEFIDKKKDGSFYWESARIAPILDSDNKITHFIKVSEDVTARKEAEENLKRREHQLREANSAKDKLLSEIAIEREKSEKLLLNILPASIANRLKAGEETIADHFDEASVIFVDLTDFTLYSSHRTPEDVVKMLNEIFTKFDKISAKYGIEKIKTIGDNYMAAAGIPVPNPNHANDMAKMAIEIMESMRGYKTTDGYEIKLRIGLHCGPIAAGVIGEQKFIYDLWGDTVNTASRMETSGEIRKIQCTEIFKEKITDYQLQIVKTVPDSAPKDIKLRFTERGLIEIKGKGKMRTYFLEYD
jgi:adenylate cyclase